MRTIIAGSRSITSYLTVEAAIEACPWVDEITEVVSGGAKGVDYLGEIWVIRSVHEVGFLRFEADWRTYGKAAGPKRNEEMAKYADALILVWDGKSRGSADMLRRAKAHGLKIYEHIVEVAL